MLMMYHYSPLSCRCRNQKSEFIPVATGRVSLSGFGTESRNSNKGGREWE
uniref:Uncharacterized protein n=1 Tax=Anguilla anguilla TaxID=7936 RepID=A0A0E9PCX2_ANGAN